MSNKTYETILKEIKKKNIDKAYLLQGEESFFIDELTSYFQNHIIAEDEKDFDLAVLYGNDINKDILEAEILQFPMLSDKRLIIVREAQMMKDIDKISNLIESIPETNCLVISYNQKYDKRKSLYKIISDKFSLFESNKLQERQINDFVIGRFQTKGLSISPEASHQMAEYLGTNVSKIIDAIDRISIKVGDKKRIDIDDILENLNIDREYNSFELLKAIIRKDVTKAIEIALFFSKNEKEHPIQSILPILFNFFANLMQVYYMPANQINEKDIASTLKVANFVAKDYITARSLYSARRCFDIIHEIRLYDAYSKGIDSNTASSELIKELIIKILS